MSWSLRDDPPPTEMCSRSTLLKPNLARDVVPDLAGQEFWWPGSSGPVVQTRQKIQSRVVLGGRSWMAPGLLKRLTHRFGVGHRGPVRLRLILRDVLAHRL